MLVDPPYRKLRIDSPPTSPFQSWNKQPWKRAKLNQTTSSNRPKIRSPNAKCQNQIKTKPKFDSTSRAKVPTTKPTKQTQSEVLSLYIYMQYGMYVLFCMIFLVVIHTSMVFRKVGIFMLALWTLSKQSVMSRDASPWCTTKPFSLVIVRGIQ